MTAEADEVRQVALVDVRVADVGRAHVLGLREDEVHRHEAAFVRGHLLGRLVLLDGDVGALVVESRESDDHDEPVVAAATTR